MKYDGGGNNDATKYVQKKRGLRERVKRVLLVRSNMSQASLVRVEIF